MGGKATARAIAAATHREVNQRRSNYNLDPLRGDVYLASVAEDYAQTMASAQKIGHEVGGTTKEARAMWWKGVSENCHRWPLEHPKAVASKVVDSWMHSRGHRANILRESSRHSGVGCWIRSGDVFISHKFARRRSLVEVTRQIVDGLR